MKKIPGLFPLILLCSLLLSACNFPLQAAASTYSEIPPDSESTPNSEIAQEDGDQTPDYEAVFPQDEVNEITIQISPENWQFMLDDMANLYGAQGTGKESMPAPGGRAPLQGERMPPGDDGRQPQQGRRPGESGGFPGGSDDSNPTWVEAAVLFEEDRWEHVGIRFKGNSSLKSTWSLGSLKLPFKLDFDQYEDDYPETKDQRFFGFKQLTFASNFHDESFLREKITADLFREAGVPSAHTAFYAVSIDYGEGPMYLGLYTAVEVVDDTVIETQFSDDSGNVYKPEGSGATFGAGSFSEASFDKETNQDEGDYSDILALYDALHDPSRLSDPDSWRENLEKVFDVDTFLNWLAVNTLIQNWDSYGAIGHNYYLYNDPESGHLVWIPWDNNESLKTGGGMKTPLSLDLEGVGDNWPLISYLRDDPVYYQTYLSYLESFLEDGFGLEEMAERYEYYHNLISPYVGDERVDFSLIASQKAFDNSVSELIQHTRQRIAAADTFLTNQ